MARPPPALTSSATASAAAPSLCALTTTAAPSPARAITTARPMFRAPPVTTATLPLSAPFASSTMTPLLTASVGLETVPYPGFVRAGISGRLGRAGIVSTEPYVQVRFRDRPRSPTLNAPQVTHGA